MNTQVVLNELNTSLTYCVFGHSVMRNLKVKITTIKMCKQNSNVFNNAFHIK